MKYTGKSLASVLTAVIAVVVLTAIALWQFYLFVVFRDSQGVLDVQGGTNHLWWAIGVGLVACAVSFFVFSAFVRRDKDDEMHITSP